MVAMTLAETREYIEALARDGGDYYVVCGRTGERPVPVAGRRFAERATARAAEQYRATLRSYDPRVPQYDLVVCEGTEARPESAAAGRPGDRPRGRASPDTEV